MCSRVLFISGRRSDARLLSGMLHELPMTLNHVPSLRQARTKLYLEEYDRPDMAIPCFKAYQNAPRAGADTFYDLGRAYEANRQPQQAAKCYETVTGYPDHPLRYDAEEALRRVREGVSAG